jgi:hypothetical protein
MIQTPVSATDHQIAILQSLANSGIRQFAAGGKARACGDSAGQEIGEAEREKRIGQLWILPGLPRTAGPAAGVAGDALFGMAGAGRAVWKSREAARSLRPPGAAFSFANCR